MKKNLLALSFLSLSALSYAQDTYIKDAVTVKVNPNTLFYNGGKVTITSDDNDATTEKIINEGNIKIVGDFENSNTTGKNFVNKFSADNQYGQLIINQSSNSTGKIGIERSKMSLSNDYYNIGLPFKGETVQTIINRMTGTNGYVGNCGVKVRCTNRYNETLLKWDPLLTEYDAVPATSTVQPGSNYTIKLNGGSVRNFISSITDTKFAMYGTPNNSIYSTGKLQSTIKGKTIAEFSAMRWGDWKGLKNNYDEAFSTYLGVASDMDNNYIYGKNLHRFSNPYTSNLDLSDISISNSWVKFDISAGNNQTPTQVFNALRFRVSRIPSDYTVNWNNQSGASNSGARISAYLQKNPSGTTPYFWAGNPDALIIRPYEYFEVDYYTLAQAANNNSRIVSAYYEFTDKQKTFDYTHTRVENVGVYARGTANSLTHQARPNSLESVLNNENLKSRGLIAPNDFTQVEFFLIQNNAIVGDAAYLVNSDFYTTGNATSTKLIDNPIMLLEEDANGEVYPNAQTLLNQFNSLDYVGKPLRLGFKNLVNGQQYNIKIRLFEYTILNQVDNLSLGQYYLLDKTTNEITEVDSSTQITFVANDNINDRFEFYWNQAPERNLATDDLNSKNKTFVYTNEDSKYVRFENNNGKAKIEIYDLTGRLISRETNISTEYDHKLKLNGIPSIFVVKITYDNGKVVNEKIITK